MATLDGGELRRSALQEAWNSSVVAIITAALVAGPLLLGGFAASLVERTQTQEISREVEHAPVPSASQFLEKVSADQPLATHVIARGQ